MKLAHQLSIIFKKAMNNKPFFIGVVLPVLVCTSVGVYAYARFGASEARVDDQFSTDEKVYVPNINDADEVAAEDHSVKQGKDVNESKATDTSPLSRDNASNYPKSNSSGETANRGGSRQLKATDYSLSTGGPEGATYAYSDVSYVDGKLMEGSLSFSKSRTFTGASSVSFGGLRVEESDLTNGTAPQGRRTIVVSQTNATSSGSAMFYVTTSVLDDPLPIQVVWRSTPSFAATKSGQTRIDTGDAIVHTFGFKITPNASFGNPILNIGLYGPAIGSCKAGSDLLIEKTYDGTKDFSLRCVVPKVVCQLPCPLVSATTIRVGISARTQKGTYISGGTNLDYVVPEIEEYIYP